MNSFRFVHYHTRRRLRACRGRYVLETTGARRKSRRIARRNLLHVRTYVNLIGSVITFLASRPRRVSVYRTWQKYAISPVSPHFRCWYCETFDYIISAGVKQTDIVLIRTHTHTRAPTRSSPSAADDVKKKKKKKCETIFACTKDWRRWIRCLNNASFTANKRQIFLRFIFTLYTG